MNKFSKRQAYENGLVLLEELLTPGTSNGRLSEMQFNGFGALKELLLPLDNRSAWSAEDLRYETEVRKFHDLLKDRFDGRYNEALSSLKNSILTSFYTPLFITEPIVESIKRNSESIESILEPAAGTGNFIKAIKKSFLQSPITAIEKDLLASEALKKLHPDIEVIHSGYENFKNSNFDLIVSNIPFGSTSVYDDHIFREAIPVKIKATTRIHNYYFVKSLDNLKNGGILAFISTNGLMDSPGNREIREHLVKNADLITAIRLPYDTFSESGTYPVTDIILLRRNAQKRNVSPSEKLFIESEKINAPDDKGLSVEVNINAYYKPNSDNALGTFSAGGQYQHDSLNVLPKDGFGEDDFRESIAQLIDEGFRQLEHKVVAKKVTEDESVPSSAIVLPRNHPDHDILKRGNLVIHQGKVGIIDYSGTEKIINPEPVIKDTDHAFHFTGLRNSLVRLVQSELDGDEKNMKAYRADLNNQYDLFTFRYGNLNHPSNKKLILFDAEGFKVLSLERLENNRYVKADIFSKQVNNVEKTFTKPESLKDAVLLSLNAHNGIQVEFISSLMQKSKDEIIREGFDQELLFRDIEGQANRYVTKDEFLSGNIVQKIEAWEKLKDTYQRNQFPELTDKDIETHLERLKEVQPVFLKRELIDINLGERWIPLDIYESFAEHLFKEKTDIKYLESTDQYLVKVSGYSNEENITYAATIHNGRISGSKIMEYAMADTQPYLQIRIEGTNPPQYKPDQDGMKNVEMKIKEVKDEFENFLNSRQDIAGRIEELYNCNINNAVRRNYDGSHLQLTGLKHFALRSHQKDAIWMLLQQDGGIVDHKVGAGKTLVMVAAAMEMRRLGITRKPLIICMKANVADVARDFLKAYPSAKVLAPDPQKDFTKQKRQRLFASIASNDWDAVIMTHDMFQAIPQSPRMKKETLEQELKNLEDDLKAVSEDRSLSKRVLKGLEGRKQNLKVRLEIANAAIRRDENILDFEKMGFDHIFVDESQAFKNLHFTTRHQHVAGLGDPSGSQRALNLELAIRTIQEKKGGDKGATFLSGTTISNSLVELYLLFKYLRPNKLNELRINSFDAWAKMYARKSATYEFTVTNELKMKERYREFIKVPELARFHAEITHVVTDSNLKIEKPGIENIVVNIDPTESQQAYTQKLINFTKTKNPAYVDLVFGENEKNAFMLIATNLARKMSIDMRLIDPLKYSFEPDGKLARMCETVATEYMDSERYKGTQLIFSDIGTPDGSGFNLYAEIKRVLVEQHGLRPDDIQFIHDHDSKTKKEKLFQDVNNGNVRVLIGSTKKLGTGVNVQERVIAMHHLDIPWRPSDFEQRIGRGGRQGNRMAKDFRENTVRNYVYAVNRTLDAYQFNILSNKQKFISQIKNSSIDQRKIDEGALDQEGGMNFGEYVALLSGNTDLLEKVKLEKKLYDLERSYQVFLKRKSEASFYIDMNNRDLKLKESALVKLEADWKPVQSIDLEKTPVIVAGKPFDDKKEAGEQLHATIEHLKQKGIVTETEIAMLLDFKLLYNPIQSKVYVSGPSGMIYNYADGKLNENPALAGRYVTDSIKRIPKVIDNTKDSIRDFQKKITIYQNELSADFKEKSLINDLKHQIDQLSERLEKAFSKEPELEGAKMEEAEQEYSKRPRKVRTRIGL
ncbi:MAG: DEAD/DEAH box helicase family protein [Cyclobacteriaceae bacterium]|nr:DEAD/DEAH box helicase family protein [Cyclobacteriaceae bacterium]